MIAHAAQIVRTHGCALVWGLLVASACSGPSTEPGNAPVGSAEPPPVAPEFCALDSGGAAVDFFTQIQPLLGERCVRCHGGVRELGAPPLNLQTREKALPALGQNGDPCSSLLLRKIASPDPGNRMPPAADALPADTVRLVGRWIAEGASWPRHWAYAPYRVVEPTQVVVRGKESVRTPIDRFILSKLESAGLSPSPEADRTTLLRRVSLDLTGLPPSPREVDDFVADTSVNAFEKVVDRMLAAPTFGETWGRHWLDQARYADTDGYEADPARPNAWRWRDWVIDAFNRDQPFDQFTIEQIAGDLLPGSTLLQKLATGFHRQALSNPEAGVDPEEDRTKRVIDRVSAVGTAWLGLTLGCAQCHSHPYDPIAQKEFYRLYAFFNNADEASILVPGIGTSPAGEADVLAENTSRPTYLLVRGDFMNPDTSEALTAGTPSVLHPFTARGSAPDRLDFARWLVDPDNTLTPRVAVNTIWYHLFGQGLVPTLEDFGSRGKLPSHPELLDWLAKDFVEHGWRRKRVIKQIVMSAAYRQSATLRADAASIDPDNVLLHRQNRLRVPAETVTDTGLAAAGILTARVGGPSVYPPIQSELLNISVYGTPWPTSGGDDAHRRAMYTFFKRTVPYPNLQAFDRPSAYASSTGRARSNTPLQALTTMHSSVFVDAARALARRAQTEGSGERRSRMMLAFRLAVARAATSEEIDELERLFQDTVTAYGADPSGATALVGDTAPPNTTPEVAAAWVVVASVILNLDETITRE